MKSMNGAFNVLIVEDDLDDFVFIKEFLFEQIKEPRLIHANNFNKAKDVLLSGEFLFDIILLDLSLHDKTGVTLIQEIIDLSLNAPIIVLTEYVDTSLGIKALSMGVSDYILKDELTAASLFKSIIYSSERKSIALALQESERQYAEIFNLSPLPMYVFELGSLRFLDVNEAFIRHYGYTREELFQMDLSRIRPPEEIKAIEAEVLTDNRTGKLFMLRFKQISLYTKGKMQ